MTKTLIAVPMKDPVEAKTRLAGSLGDAQRARLAEALFARTLAFLRPVVMAHGAELVVVTRSRRIRALADAAAVNVIEEGAVATLSGAATAAGAWAAARGFDRICLIPADLAAPLESDVARLLYARAEVVICPSEDGGTNALAVSPPDALAFHYGPGSAEAHESEAAQRGLSRAVLPLRSLSFDIDTSEGLARARAIVPALEAAL
ncbi:MAG: 2-phospho-L-lactate guanylyltransferase [Pseudomonadota bacterium]